MASTASATMARTAASSRYVSVEPVPMVMLSRDSGSALSLYERRSAKRLQRQCKTVCHRRFRYTPQTYPDRFLITRGPPRYAIIAAMNRRSALFRVAALFLFVFCFGVFACVPTAAASDNDSASHTIHASKPHRLIVLTDIGAEVDDTESMVRLLLYSDVFLILGL